VSSPRESTAPTVKSGVEMTKIIADQPADATPDAPGPEFLPLRGLADILTALLAVVVAFICIRLAVQLLSSGSVHYVTDFRLDKAADITMLGLSILFLVWFYRAGINAERHGYPQRRARGWAYAGWIVPIVNLWFPFQIMGDIWRAGLPAWQRRETALLITIIRTVSDGPVSSPLS
jgi:hypothetical protein